jgi:hypothetical protein
MRPMRLNRFAGLYGLILRSEIRAPGTDKGSLLVFFFVDSGISGNLNFLVSSCAFGVNVCGFQQKWYLL